MTVNKLTDQVENKKERMNMPIVQAKCTNCGANLEVDSTKDAAVCPFCGAAYVVEKAINNFNTVNNNQILAQTVNIYGSSGDFTITSGTLLQYTGSSTHPVVPAEVRFIADEAFKGLRALETVTLPEGLREIGKSAFSGCDSLTDVMMPDTVESIGDSAFFNCSRLKNIKLPANLNYLGKGAFRYCNSLNCVIFPDGIKHLENTTFQSCTNLKDVKLPSTLTEIGGATFEFCESLDNLKLPNDLRVIDKSCFEYCKSLKSILIPSSVSVINQEVFLGCTGLKSVTFQNGLKELGSKAFYGCTGLLEIELPDSLGTRGSALYDGTPSETFAGCTALKSVKLSAGMDLLHDKMFNGCTALENLTVPNSAVKFDSQCFVGAPLININAPEEWKSQHAWDFDCLSSYRKKTHQKKGCYVATAVYGSYNCPEVWVLRRWRDQVLSKSSYGRAFIHCYYTISPIAVKYFGKTKLFSRIFRPRLDKLTERLRAEGFSDTPYKD
jgi:predicted RNA-binding Zn-ribbon protein involved in translation (DUF1610 family)